MIDMGKQLDYQLRQRGWTHSDFARRLTPHLKFLKGQLTPTGQKKVCSRQYVYEIVQSKMFQPPTLTAVSKALKLPVETFLQDVPVTPAETPKGA